MSSPVLSRARTILCAHGGHAAPSTGTTRVTVSGAPVITQSTALPIGGCPLPASLPPGPCASGQFMTAASRVTVMGQPVLLADGISISTPGGLAMQVVAVQQRVRAL